MNYYEKVLIVDPNLDDAAVEEIVGKIKDIITKQSGEIIKVDNWGRRKLAYELNKQQKGNYVLLHFKAPPPTILEIEKYCGLVDTIIKFMILKITKKKQIDAILQAPAETAVKPAAKPADDTAKPAEEKPAQAAEGVTAPKGE
jgi:small subunit ribosomal protein S6